MEVIALNKRKQNKLKERVTKIKGELNNGLKLREDVDKDQAKSKRNLESRGVIYIGHIPHGFYEDEIRGYCSQFGIVTRVRLARSSKTGRSKGYAFVEFLHGDVAKIVAETMNNYLMFNRLLKCEFIPSDKRHKQMFQNSITATSFPKLKRRERDTELKNKLQKISKENEAKLKARRKIDEFKKFFEARGIEFNFKVNDPSCETPQNDDEVVLEIDESDDEIEFSSPANIKKVFKRSDKTPAARLLAAKRTKRKELIKKTLKTQRNKGH